MHACDPGMVHKSVISTCTKVSTLILHPRPWANSPVCILVVDSEFALCSMIFCTLFKLDHYT